MPISQNTYTVPNNFVQQYDLGQKKIRADLVDENFTDAAGAINTLLTDDANTMHLTGAETISGDKTFTGTNVFGANTTGVTAAAGDNSTKFATTAFVQAAKPSVPSASSSTPAARSTSGSAGTSTAYARADHSHPKNWGTSSSVTATAPAVVVEAWRSGANWYRVWSDGWIEQGGMTAIGSQVSGTITFNKAFSDTNYVFSCICQSTTVNITYGPIAKAKTTSTIGLYGGSQLQNVYWYACGF